MAQTAHEAMQMLVGRELASVEFVRDYVQLRFDGPVLSAYTMPKLDVHERKYSTGEDGYCDALVGMIGTVVTEVDVQSEMIQIGFASGTQVTISLRDEDRLSTEAALFSDADELLWSL
jgi:hypothetical protein